MGSFWHQIWKDRQKLSPKKLFWSWWRQRWRHVETLDIARYIHVCFTSVHFSAMVQYIRNKCYALSHPCTFQLWCNISETNAMHYHMALSIGYIKNFSLRIYLQNWLRYRHSKCHCCLLHSAINILARVTKLNTIRDQHIGYVSWKFQRNRLSSFWDTALLSMSSARSAQHGLLTHLCFRCTNIVLTAKRS